MKQASNAYNINDKVFVTMFIVAIAFLLLMSFRYKGTEPCKQVNFSFRTANKLDVAYTNEKIYFSSDLKYDAENWEWDFGDKSPRDNKSGPYTSHEYLAPGQYTVRLIINENCQEVMTINVNKREDKSKKLFLRPVWPAETVYAGTEYTLSDSTFGAVTWSWYVDDEPKKTNQRIRVLFSEPGMHRVSLVVNEDIENNKVERSFVVLKPKVIVQNQPPNVSVVNANPGGGGVNLNKPITENLPSNGGNVESTDKSNPLSFEDIMNNANKVQPISDGTLKAHVLDVNGGGANAIAQLLVNKSFKSCVILFNNRTLNLDQLKSNIVEHNKNGESIAVKHEVDPKTNQITVLEITAALKPKKGFLGMGGGERKYPH
jgi:PKD repeat protein